MFWDNYYNLCHDRRKSPNAVAKELGFSVTACTHWKQGSVPRSQALKQIADYFGVPESYLIEEHENKAIAIQSEELTSKLSTLTQSELESVSQYVDFLLSKKGNG